MAVGGCGCEGGERGREERTAQGREITATHKTTDNSSTRTQVSTEERNDASNTGVMSLYVWIKPFRRTSGSKVA
jgi:hypothetical protein